MQTDQAYFQVCFNLIEFLSNLNKKNNFTIDLNANIIVASANKLNPI